MDAMLPSQCRRDILRSSVCGALSLALHPLATAASGVAMRRVEPLYFGLHMRWPVREPYVQNFPTVPFAAWRALVPETHWFSLEPRKGEWHFEKLDIAMRLMESRGIDVLLTLVGLPTWASSKPLSKGAYQAGEYAPPRDMQEWESYVSKVATRYRGRISHYELLNEPRVREVDGEKAFYSAAEMVELARITYGAIKRSDPNAQLTSPAFDGGFSTGTPRLEAFLAAGGGKYMDVVSFHFYGLPHEISLFHKALKAVLGRYNLAHLPIWNTEFGYLINDPNSPNTHPISSGAFARVLSDVEAGAWLGRSMITAAALGIERFYWFMWDNQSMALITLQDRRINAAGLAYGTVTRWLTGRLIGNLERAGDVEYCRLADDSGVLGYLVWSYDYKVRQWQVPDAWAVQAVSRVDGTTGEVLNGQFIAVSAGPIFLSVK